MLPGDDAYRDIYQSATFNQTVIKSTELYHTYWLLYSMGYLG